MIPFRLPVRADIFGLLLLANAGCTSAEVTSRVPTPLVASSAATATATATTTTAAFNAEPAVGAAAPDFVAAGHDGANVSLSSLRGRTVILFFYTRDETPKAIREAIDFRDVSASLL